MLKIITLCIITLFVTDVTAQTVTKADISYNKCKKCFDTIHARYLSKYYSKKDIVKNHMTEYFGMDLEKNMGTPAAPKYLSILKFDALGCIYPQDTVIKVFEDRFNHKKRQKNDKIKDYVFRHTFYNVLLKSESEKNLISSDDLAKYKISRSIPDSNMLKWRKEWNENYLPTDTDSFKNKISAGQLKRIVFLVHGYNVPYSIAQIQHNSLIDLAKENNPAMFDSTLFVKVFWPSTNRKKIVDRRGFWEIKNKFSAKSISNFTAIINRSLLIGLGLREVLNGIPDFEGEVMFAGHSMGSPIISAALINPIQKLTIDKKPPLWKATDLHALEGFKKEFKNAKFASYKFSKISAFLNAPSMPGIETFHHPEITDMFKETYWTIGFNPTDRVLNKTFSIFRFGDQNGNTRLGGNWENETWKTKDYVEKYELKSHFKFIRTGQQYDLFGHDFFCYLLQPEYQKGYEDFIMSK